MGARNRHSRGPQAEPQPHSRVWLAATLAFAVTWLAALIRWWPLTQYNIWGSDAGEYAGLAETYLGSGGGLPSEYSGWGGGYPDFKGMYIVVGTFSQIAGLDSFYVLSVVIPAAAAISALFAFVIALRLSQSLFAAAAAGGIVATAMPEVFASSHGMPGALGGMFVIAMMAVAVFSVRTPAARWAVIPLAFAVVFTHHLSSFLAIVMFGTAALLEARLAPADVERGRAVDVCLLAAGTLMLASAAFWSWGAPQFRTQLLDGASPWIGRLLPGAALLGVTLLVVLTWYLETRPRSRKRFIRVRSEVAVINRMALAVAATLAALVISVTIGVPGTRAIIPLDVALLFTPLCFTLALVAGGLARMMPVRGSLMLFAAAVGVIVSAAVGWRTLPTLLIPYRHVQYFVDVGAPLAAVALAHSTKAFSLQMFPGRRDIARPFAAFLVVLLLVGCLWSAYPSKDHFAGFQEGTVDTEVAALVWLTWDMPATYIASDHRLSSMAYGFAYHDATWEASTPILIRNASDMGDALETVRSPSGSTGVTVVLLSKDIIEGAALSQWEPATPIKGPALAKFNGAPFVRAFDNGDAVAFWVAWGV